MLYMKHSESHGIMLQSKIVNVINDYRNPHFEHRVSVSLDYKRKKKSLEVQVNPKKNISTVL